MHPRDSRQLHDLEKLRDAIREQLPQRKTASPPGSPDHRYISNSVLSSTDNLPPLDANSSRYDLTTSDGEHSSSTTPPDHDIEFPRMVRKKSGEVVKPSLKPACLKRRPLSLPCTPVYPKAVHFDTKLEHVRHFVHSEKPLAVSTDTSPSGEHVDFPFEKDISEKQYQIELPNFPSNEQSNRRDLPVHVDSVFLASNGPNLIGNVIVKNIAFNKWVAVRFTFDHWQTISEVSATYDSTQDNGTTPKDPAWDRFTFSIKLVDFTNLENRQMLFCVRYNVMDQEYWDNNYGSNYRVEFRKRPNHLLRRSPYPPNANGLYHRASDDSAIGEDFDIDISPETFAKDLAKQITSVTGLEGARSSPPRGPGPGSSAGMSDDRQQPPEGPLAPLAAPPAGGYGPGKTRAGRLEPARLGACGADVRCERPLELAEHRAEGEPSSGAPRARAAPRPRPARGARAESRRSPGERSRARGGLRCVRGLSARDAHPVLERIDQRLPRGLDHVLGDADGPPHLRRRRGSR